MTAPTFTRPDQANRIANTLSEVIRWADRNSARSAQVALGPSELGDPCLRKLAYRLLGMEPVNLATDPWAAIVGTATHAWLADALQKDNAHRMHNGQPRRWLIEERVMISDFVAGTCDLYDTDTCTVIDHKVLGTASMKELSANGAKPVYRTQLHLYGYGHERAGRAVRTVAIVGYPRSGFLDGVRVWSEPYQPAIAEAALARLAGIETLVNALDLPERDDRWPLVPAEASRMGCTWCPFFSGHVTTAGRAGCPGPRAAA